MDLRINYEEVTKVGKQITLKGEEFRSLLTRVRNVNSNLTNAWQGSDATKYTTAVEEQSMYMEKLANAIDEIGGFMVKVGNVYREVNEQNANSIRMN